MSIINKPGKIVSPPTQSSAGEASGEFKEQNIKYVLSKFEYDLYHEEDKVVTPIIRIKRTSMPNKGEKWKIFENNKIMFTIEGTKLSLKEREFLRSVDGVNFLIMQFKNGIKSFNSLKIEIKKQCLTTKK